MFAGSVSRVADRGSLVAVRESRFAVHGSWVAVRRSRFAIPTLRRHTIVARNVCYADVRAVWPVFHVVVSAVRGSRFRRSSATLFPRGTSVVGTFGRCGPSSMSLSQRFAVRDSVAQTPHYFRAERPLWGRSGGVARLSCRPMSIDAGCGGSRVGPHSCSTTWGTPGAYKGTWSPIHWSVCGADARVSKWGIPVGVVVLAPHCRYLHNRYCISGGVFVHK